ncbi:Hypothetical predicted protein [Mytilus galloprovincialis]|uniref:CCHC-type domain-containing protein n=1 Tax=Mytilus galloprovincialis TaxID=29158 RepID=A0A8B6FDI7_MYTGA|nr:Hypothetical predicted protein [Mytilus galloprovincialis]
MSDTEVPIPSKESVEPDRNSDEDVSNADLFSLFTTYMNSTLAGIERNLDDKTQSLAKKSILTVKGRATKLLEESSKIRKKRNKLIRIADKSEGGWNTVQEYLSDDVASNSEDEKRIKAAERRAVRKIQTTKTEKKQGRKRPAEAAGAPSQGTHNGGSFIPTISTQQPFRVIQGQAGPSRQAKAGDMCYSCANFGHLARDCRAKDKQSGYRGDAV